MKSRAGRAAFGAALLGVAALVGLLAWSGHRPAPLRRFVSLPLADGCRYTFVYPADARLMSVGPGSVVFFEGRDWGRSALVQFLLRNGLLSRGPHRLISVDTNNWNQGARNFRRAARTPPQSFDGVRNAAVSVIMDRVDVYDARLHRCCWLTDYTSGPPPGTPALDARIRDSFRLLAPGETPPRE